MLKILLALQLFAFAGETCRWTAEAAKYRANAVYRKGPSIEKQSCNGPDAPPVCKGFVYCQDDEKSARPTRVVNAACKAVKKDGKWSCPTAQDCGADNDVAVEEMTSMPAKVGQANPAGGGGGMREGVGGR